jgi:hypothetical protein
LVHCGCHIASSFDRASHHGVLGEDKQPIGPNQYLKTLAISAVDDRVETSADRRRQRLGAAAKLQYWRLVARRHAVKTGDDDNDVRSLG